MILYLDASALVKRYVAEAGSADVARLIGEAEAVGTGLLSRAEVTAALAKAVRTKVLTRRAATVARRRFEGDWPSLVRLQVGEPLVARAAALAWEHGLRGYDATHLAAAALWQEVAGRPVTVATYDRQLWAAARGVGLAAWPAQLG
ncbi:MAG: type II toxin-antitoxin system VapC family toxin [Gemmatimonadales bacterium]|nr:type II toxin-antitoxin system VapC family toxin [Gemmatimonadales bacterium]